VLTSDIGWHDGSRTREGKTPSFVQTFVLFKPAALFRLDVRRRVAQASPTPVAYYKRALPTPPHFTYCEGS
jgi:hypothetical protein